MSIVSNNIKYLRRLNGLTQEQFARKIGIKRSLLGAYEEARANPNLTNLKNMAHAFGVSVDQMLKNDLRRLRETPDLGLPFHPASRAMSPLLAEESPIATPPKPLSTFVSNYTIPKPSLRIVSRPVALKPVHRDLFKNETAAGYSQQTSSAQLRFNNQFKDASSSKPEVQEEPKTPLQTIQWVKSEQANQYLANYESTTYLNQLPVFHLPTLPAGNYRAFEADKGFAYPGSLLVGSFVRNWYDIKDDTHYTLLIHKHGLLSRRIFNQVKARGVLVLTSEDEKTPDLEVPIKEVLEVWEIRTFISLTLPKPAPAYQKLKNILGELKQELNRTADSGGFLT